MTFTHHVRISVAGRLEFQRDRHLQTATLFAFDQVIDLWNWLATAIAAALLWLNALPLHRSRFRRYWRGWVIDLLLTWEAAWLPVVNGLLCQCRRGVYL